MDTYIGAQQKSAVDGPCVSGLVTIIEEASSHINSLANRAETVCSRLGSWGTCAPDKTNESPVPEGYVPQGYDKARFLAAGIARLLDTIDRLEKIVG